MSFVQDLLVILSAVAEDAVLLVLLGTCITFGFSIAFLLCYGDYTLAHSTLGNSMLSLYHLMLGNNSAAADEAGPRMLGPLFTVGFTMLMALLLVNMLVAVLVRASFDVKPSPGVITVIRRKLNHPRAKRRLARFAAWLDRASCGLLSSSAPDATEDIVEDLGQNIPADETADPDGKTDLVHGGNGAAASGSEAAMLKRIEGKLTHDMDLNLQCLLQLSKEVRSLSHRIKHLTETAQEPSVFS